MKKIWYRKRTLVGILAFTLTLSACGGGNGDSQGSTAPPVAPAEPVAPTEPVAPADDTETPLAGELITLVVGVSPGGGFDTYARFMAPYLSRELGANVVVANEPGAGSLLALNSTWAAPPDGTRIMIVNGFGVLGAILGGSDGIEFKLDEFEYIGRIDASLQIVSVHERYAVQDPFDFLGSTVPIVWSATGPGGGTANSGNLLCISLSMANCRVATGYSGSAEAILGVTTGEVDAIATDAASLIPTFNGNGQVPVFALTANRHPELPEVPTILELGLTGEEFEIARAHVALLGAGRLLVAPPGTPDNIMAALRAAYDRMVTDPAFLADAAARGLGIDTLDAAAALELVETSLNAPDSVVQVFSQAG